MAKGQGGVYKPKGTANYYIHYSVNGKLYRETSGSPDKDLAINLLRQRIDSSMDTRRPRGLGQITIRGGIYYICYTRNGVTIRESSRSTFLPDAVSLLEKRRRQAGIGVHQTGEVLPIWPLARPDPTEAEKLAWLRLGWIKEEQAPTSMLESSGLYFCSDSDLMFSGTIFYVGCSTCLCSRIAGWRHTFIYRALCDKIGLPLHWYVKFVESLHIYETEKLAIWLLRPRYNHQTTEESNGKVELE